MSHSCYYALVRPILLAVAAIPLAAAAVAQTTPTGSSELTYHVDVRERGEDRPRPTRKSSGPYGNAAGGFADPPGPFRPAIAGPLASGARALTRVS